MHKLCTEPENNILLSENALFCSNGHCGFVAGESCIRASAVSSLLSLLFCLCIFDLRQNGDLFEYVKKERKREPPYMMSADRSLLKADTGKRIS